MSHKNNKLTSLRKNIDKLDNQIIDILNKRAAFVIEVGKLKHKENMAIYAPERERDIYKGLSDKNNGPFPDKALKNVFREIISGSLSLERLLTVAFLGPRATFTELACMRHFGLSAEFVPKNDIADVFDAVARGASDYGVVPIENTIEGVVSHTLDMFITSELKICAEVLMQVQLTLLNRSGKIEDVSKMFSHPHAIAECKGWLKKHLPNTLVYEISSTAMAAKMASEDPDVAAIASESAAETYNLKIIERNVQDQLNNYTRFLVIGRTTPKKSGTDKTSIMVMVKDSPGVLYEILKSFSQRAINLTKIESRPQKNKVWEYLFFLDMDGHITDKNISDALKEIGDICMLVKVLGSYPKTLEK